MNLAAISHGTAQRCLCLSGLPYGECCEPLHNQSATASTAEQLMRSRYSAFALGITDYLLATWHPSTRPASLELESDLRWYRLDILGTSGGGIKDASGTVEFEARYRSSAGAGSHNENSRFVKLNGRWFYLSGSESNR